MTVSMMSTLGMLQSLGDLNSDVTAQLTASPGLPESSLQETAGACGTACPPGGEDSLSTLDQARRVAAWALGSVWTLTRRGTKMVGKIMEAGLTRMRMSSVTVGGDVAQSTKEENAYWVLRTLSGP